VMNSRVYLVIILVFSLTGCKRNFKDIHDYAKYIYDEKNGLTNSKVMNGLKYSVSFFPHRILI
jgi:hypothetical protein